MRPTTLLIRRNGSSSEYVGTVESIILDNGGTLVTDPANAPKNRRIEFFGDSVTAGANIEPLSDSPDINNDGDYYDDNYNAYSAQTARNLNADAHFTAQGGIGLLNGFLPPDGNDPNSDTTIPDPGPLLGQTSLRRIHNRSVQHCPLEFQPVATAGGGDRHRPQRH